MTQQLLTRCPHCETLFKLYPRQIEAAGGYVRCGACMKVFKAHKHILDPLELPTVETLSAENLPSISSTSKPSWREELTEDINKVYQHIAAEHGEQKAVALGNPNQGAPPPKQSPPNDPITNTNAQAIKSKKSRLPKFEDDFTDSFKNLPLQKHAGHRPTNIMDTNIDDINESWAKKMLQELDDEIANSSTSVDATQPFQQPPSPKIALLSSQLADTPDAGILNAALANNLIHELSGQTKKNNAGIHTNTGSTSTPLEINPYSGTERRKQTRPSISAQLASETAERSFHLIPLETNKLAFPPSKGQLTAIPSTTSSLSAKSNLSKLPNDSDNDFYVPSRRQQTFSIRYTLGCLFLVAVLFAEYAFYNFTTLNQTESLRPLYVLACQVLNCAVPPRQDLNKIINLNVIVQQHPTINHALRANILINNQANFAQPFPYLKLTFTDLNQRVIAERQFSPAEYQKDELSNLPLMPSNQPIRLMFDFWDPGESAISSELSICQIQNQVLRCKS